MKSYNGSGNKKILKQRLKKMPAAGGIVLTYDFGNVEGPLYDYVYRCIKKDIISGILAPGEKLPSKRSFARNNGISTITIQNAYDQLISEGYVYTIPKTGYYVADIEGMAAVSAKADVSYDIRIPENDGDYIYDLSDNGMNPANFRFPCGQGCQEMSLRTVRGS